MVLSQALRSIRFKNRGLKDHAAAVAPIKAALAQNSEINTSAESLDAATREAFCRKYLGHRCNITVRCGLHMIDMYGHVNNANYLEILEYGRWHQFAFLGVVDFFTKRKGMFIVSDLSIQYVREIKPFSKVQVTTQFIAPSNRPATPSGEGIAMPSGDTKRMLVSQAIWNQDGSKLHAAAVLEAALLAPNAYAAELTERYGSRAPPSSSSSSSSGARKGPVRPYSTLDCNQVLADCSGMSLTEVEDILYSSRERLLGTPSATGDGDDDWLSRHSSAGREWRASVRKLTKPREVPE